MPGQWLLAMSDQWPKPHGQPWLAVGVGPGSLIGQRACSSFFSLPFWFKRRINVVSHVFLLRPRFAPYSNTCQGSVMLLRSRSYLLRRSLLTRVVTPMLVQKAAVEDSVLEMLPEYVGLHGGKCSLVWALRREE